MISSADFKKLIAATSKPVILIEGRRALPQNAAAELYSMGKWLAAQFPEAIFRSGNAEGSDTEFTSGVLSIDPSRMQYVLPSPNMGRWRRHPDSPTFSLADLPHSELEELCDLSIKATPGVKRLADAVCGRIKSGPLAGKGRYLVRDTFKVLGSAAIGLDQATLGLFYVNLDDPDAGGTGHTIHVCRRHGVKVAFQDSFLDWMRDGE